MSEVKRIVHPNLASAPVQSSSVLPVPSSCSTLPTTLSSSGCPSEIPQYQEALGSSGCQGQSLTPKESPLGRPVRERQMPQWYGNPVTH